MPKHLKQKGLAAIYTMHSIQGFAFSLIGIFIPIYLLTIGYSVAQVLIYFIVYYGLVAAFSFLAIFIASRIGLERTILCRFPFTFTYLILLYLLPQYAIPLFLIAVFAGLECALYWIPLHILFARNTQSESVGSSTGKLFAFPQIASIAGPFLGGLIAAVLGFPYLIGLVSIVMLFSVLPLLNLGLKKEPAALTGPAGLSRQLANWGRSLYRDFRGLLPAKTSFRFDLGEGAKLFKKHPKFFFAEIFDNMGEEAEAIIWPIFIFLSLASIATVGAAGSLLAFGSIIFTLMIGKISDKVNKKTLIKMGALLLLTVWAARYFTHADVAILVTTVLAGFFMVLLLVPYTSLGYDAAKKDRTAEYFVFREIPVFIGRALILSVALLLVANLELSFLIAGAAYLYFLIF